MFVRGGRRGGGGDERSWVSPPARHRPLTTPLTARAPAVRGWKSGRWRQHLAAQSHTYQQQAATPTTSSHDIRVARPSSQRERPRAPFGTTHTRFCVLKAEQTALLFLRARAAPDTLHRRTRAASATSSPANAEHTLGGAYGGSSRSSRRRRRGGVSADRRRRGQRGRLVCPPQAVLLAAHRRAAGAAGPARGR